MDRYQTNLQINEPNIPRGEVLSGPERRRRWSAKEKARIVAESLLSNAAGSAVARRYGIHPNQLYGWRRELRLAMPQMAAPFPEFVPVSLTEEVKVPDPVVEILVGGVVVRASPGVDLAFLSDVLRVVREAS
ncbi:transposase [Alphaproteobacteria bacterium]|nr:transposase [Alphaproteobacteria bacterium]